MKIMKSLKILSLFFILFVFGAHTGFAQAQATDLTDEQKEQIAQNMEEFQEVLALSEKQKSEFEAITKKYVGQMVAVRDGGGNKYAKYRKVKSIRKNRNAEMKKLLSEEQYELYQKKQEEMQKKMREKRG